ncbi:MAG TPA: glutamine synthetase, partial [Parvularcula sp.]|nr:glutamine synthetase [Parvularcula sp.]
GLEKKLTPPPALTGNVYASAAPRLDIGWRAALSAFEDGQALNPAFGPLFTQVYGALKRQEMRAADRRVTDFEYDSYLFAF